MENVDEAELKKFEALAARWWDAEGEFKPLHDINPLRMGYISGLRNPAGLRVLDVGCGGGILAETLARHGAVVTAIDKGEASLAVARIHLRESRQGSEQEGGQQEGEQKGGLDIDYRYASAEEMAAETAGDNSGGFDMLTCLEMLEHVPRPQETVAACAQLLKPGGLAFFSTINRNLQAFLFAIVGAEYILRLLPRGTHDYDKLIRPAELAAWCRSAGLDLVAQTGMGYNPLTKNYFLQKSLAVNYIACYQKPA